ncbi:uncharacterized protein [Argopecten irradians]|uniref:uncharacterized protein n=1 Tax=Argopecten irradians TaxID=31199 RepID=UPI00371BE6B8
MEEYQNTAISFNNDRYIAKLPWREDHQELPTNEFVTRNRTINVVKRLAREPNLLKMNGDISDQEKRGFIEKVSDDNIKSGDKIHYIPHHPVKKDSTTPIRIIQSGTLRRHVFSILNATLLKHLNGSQTELFNDLQRNLYVDNILSSVNTEQEALHYFRGSRDLLRQAGFNLRSWSSNSKNLRKSAENENVHDTDNVVKILGMRWNPVSDTIAFAEKARADIDTCYPQNVKF